VDAFYRAELLFADAVWTLEVIDNDLFLLALWALFYLDIARIAVFIDDFK